MNIGLALLLEKGDFKFLRTATFTVAEMKSDKLNIDPRYQRHEIKAHVVDLIGILKSGGVIPDPIWIAERPNKTLWIIDGQQRYWAHWHVGKPLTGRIYSVPNWETERRIFHILNSRKTVQSAHKAITWPGPGGDLLRWLSENQHSALRGMVSDRTQADMPASTIAKSLVLALKNSHVSSGIKPTMETLDRIVLQNKKRAYKTAEMLAVILYNVFEDQKAWTLAARGIGKVCFARWHDRKVNAAWPMPTKAEYAKLRRVNWKTLTPSQEHRWLPVVADEIAHKWRSNSKP